MSKILIVDDEPGILDALTCWHTKQGHQITCAKSGDAAVRLISEFKPDLVLTDIKMSPGDGFRVLVAAKKQDPRTAVILMTGHTVDATTQVEGLKLGADDYICKPFKLEELDKRIDYALRYRQALLAKKMKPTPGPEQLEMEPILLCRMLPSIATDF